jgi:hypothetical protein
MLMGCHHLKDDNGLRRLGQPVNGWEFPDGEGLSLTFPATLGTDTCGDLIYDGIYTPAGRLWPQKMGLDAESTDTYGPMYEWTISFNSIPTGWYHRKIVE